MCFQKTDAFLNIFIAIRRVCSWQPNHVHKGQPPASWSASVAIKNYHKLHCAPEFQHNFDQILKTLCHDKKNRLVKTRFTWEPQSVIVQSDSFAGLTNQVSTRSDKLSEEKIVQNRETRNDQINNSGGATT